MAKTKDLWPAHALAKLASSGLTPADARALGIAFLPAFQVHALHESFEPVDALHLTYTNPATGAGFVDLPARPPFYRLRYLRPPATSFGEQDKRRRYTNEPGFMVHAYFPTAPDVDWPALLADPSEPLFITEGELKAAKATLEGFPTIGLGGVDSFASAARGVRLLPELEAITWAKRRVYVVYDSDAATNPDVRRAMNRLAKVLGNHGALTYEVKLPAGEGEEKVGLDDYLVAHGPEAFAALLEANFEQGPEPLAYNDPLFKLNDEVVFVLDPGFFIHQRSGTIWKKDAFALAYANLPKVKQRTETKQGPSWREVTATSAWVEWEQRRTAGKLVYEPRPVGQALERFTSAADPLRTTWNVWPGWGVTPAPGDVSPFLELLDHIFRDADPAHRTWFLSWLAFPLQYPGVKLNTACLFHGRQQGSGKTLIGVTMGRIYGQNYQLIRNKQLAGSFNSWAVRKQFVLGDEISGGESHDKKLAEELKSMVTQETITINTKNVPEYDLRDCINYYFTSNFDDALKLDDEDRRFFVWRMPDEVLDRIEFFKLRYGLWLDSAAGPAALFHHLLHEVDVSDFDQEGKAPMTDAKANMINEGKSDLDQWCARLRDAPELVLKTNGTGAASPYDLFRPLDLLLIYQSESANGGRDRVAANGMGRALGRAGFAKANGGNNVAGEKYYIIRNRERWLNATHDELAAHLKDPRAAVGNVVTTTSRRTRKY
jgi:hypothetical protein